MIAAIDKIKVEEYEFLLEYKNEREGLPYVLWVFKNGEPLMQHHQPDQINMNFPANFSRAFLVDVCHRFVSNEQLNACPA
ncbi:hypothetical protein D1B33_14310 [Lysinibacillus yapensis]|uniref:Uncharacterized protein n=1 Tax=Ureibacillus yapensis TaxID=2304605 RepID=A0A396SJG1_9BACL|nr:hypothetical protein [Lysinibacillus yapensis]RHW33977.1 hypothetical protein D1B33_14310 [Lysinibacillus yapensis]